MAYKDKVCPICGEVFTPNSPKQKYCKKLIVLKCAVCGENYIGYCQPDNVSVCSKSECKNLAASVGARAKVKTCRVCGKEFTPNSSRQLDCNRPVTKICIICGKEFIGKCSKNDVSKTCSSRCQTVYAHNQSVESYQQEIRICTLCEKEFTPVNNTQKICSDTHYRTCEVCGKQFILDTSKNQADWPRTCSDKCHRQLAHDNVSEEAMRKYILNMRIRRHKDNPESLREYLEFLNNPEKYMQNNFADSPIAIKKLARKFGIHETTMGNHINTNNLQKYIEYNVSAMEDELYDFLLTMIDDKDIVRHDRSAIKPKELDLFVPKYSLGIECNPTSSHNSSLPFFDSEIPVPPSYHKSKTDACEAAGIQLFHIFGYEWTHKRDIIESMLRNLLGKNLNKVFARDTVVEHISTVEANEFLTENHRQGYARAKVELGLRDGNNRLVSVMTFGKPRGTIGDGNYDYELIRFCNFRDTSVVGGASKLFKYFVSRYHPKSIVSFSDRAHTCGNLYKVLGFEELRRSDPGYVWVDAYTDIAYNRVNAQKHNIKKFLGDDTIDLTKTEREIMIGHGFVQVYDSGTITWRWNSNDNSYI